jgi:6-phosphogluconolactonase
MDRRRFLLNLGLSSAALMISKSKFINLSPGRNPFSGFDLSRQDFYVGTFGTGQDGGIYYCHLDVLTGEIILRGETRGIDNPAFLVIDSSNRFLYAVNEVSVSDGFSGGSVSSFVIQQENGSLTFINKQPTLGASPCYITIDPADKFILATNYTGGSIIVFPVLDGGNIGRNVDFIQNRGHSVNSDRQESPHPHSIILSPDIRYAYVPDLGLDKILIYRFNRETGDLAVNAIPSIPLKPGAGPRHFTFHPNHKFAYVINELNSTITGFRYRSMNGKLTEIQTIGTLPEEFQGENFCADIHVHPNGKFLYGSNRGHNSIACYSIDQSKGKLEMIGCTSTLGDWPRNFAIDPSGQYLLAANQRSNNIVSFRINQESGILSPTGYSVEISQPVCIKFMN